MSSGKIMRMGKNGWLSSSLSCVTHVPTVQSLFVWS